MPTLTYEFVVPSAPWVIKTDDWEPIPVVRWELFMRVGVPIVGSTHTRVNETIGNEGLVLDYSVMRIEVDVQASAKPPEWYVPFALVKECFSWIRVAGRQYWLGTLMAMTESTSRGSVIDNETGHFTNFAATLTPFFPKPLSKEIWELVGRELRSGRKPPFPDNMFCDALLNFRNRDYLQSVIGLGVACELELNSLIDDLLELQPENLRKVYRASRPQFDWKLRNMPEILGAESYQSHDPVLTDKLCLLYSLRGSAVHRAECLVHEENATAGRGDKAPAGFSHVSSFIFAVDDFLRWAKGQRAAAGLPFQESPTSAISHMIGVQGA